MTVELVTDPEVPGQSAFAWPDEPKDWTPWGKERFEEARKEQGEAQERMQKKQFGTAWPTDVESVAGKAEELFKKAGKAGDLVRVGWREELRKRREEEQKAEDEKVKARMEGRKEKDVKALK